MHYTYNIDFTIAALVILLSLLGHSLRNGRSSSADSRFFLRIMVLIIILGVADIVDIVVLKNPTTPLYLCEIVCAIYLTIELLACALLTFFIPLVITDVTERDRKILKLLLIPVAFFAVLVLFVNYPTGLIFTISASHVYVNGPFNYLLQVSDGFYIAITKASWRSTTDGLTPTSCSALP